MKQLNLPLTKEDCQSLQAGEMVEIAGTVYTARDAAHKRLMEMIQKKEKLPFPLANSCIYYVGPTPAKPNQVIGSAGPTTSSRMDVYTPTLYELGVIATIGKGKRSKEVKDSIINSQTVYFSAIGGAGAYLSQCIIASEVIAFEDLQSEAIRKLEVKNFPVIVAMDCKGNSIYD
ncbi:MAG: Fe-S-containing hydro-lyase [Erysipelotrichaceae bacterium]|nr:Fe-S-containing hydro-lyase [Erysipelotrichaceae bacterium]